jgi:hypothetical protein
MDDLEVLPTTAAALEHWLVAEQASVFIRRNLTAADLVSIAATSAAEAAVATAASAKNALDASLLAEASASKTAQAAELAAVAARSDYSTSMLEVGTADEVEGIAHQGYLDAVARGKKRSK